MPKRYLQYLKNQAQVKVIAQARQQPRDNSLWWTALATAAAAAVYFFSFFFAHPLVRADRRLM